MAKLSLTRRQQILDLLAADPAVEWCSEEVAERLDMPLGSAGSVLSTMWADRVVYRHRDGMRFWYRHQANGRPADPAAPAPEVDASERIAATWVALGLGSWSAQQVDLALMVADYVRGPRLDSPPRDMIG